MIEEQYLSLCEKYLNGDCTLQEELLLKKYQEKFDIANDLWDSKQMGDQQRIKLLLQNKLLQSMHTTKTRSISINKRWYAAAAILLFSAMGVYFFRGSTTNQDFTTKNSVKKVNTAIEPDSKKAILTLSNGKSFVLDNAGNGLLSQQGGTAISKTSHGLTIKNSDGMASAQNAPELNTITIPRGSKYEIVLPDGTKVWLNASSSLQFPSAFTGTERKVTLIGEAYFEVAKNKDRPFKINVNDKQVVEVLGTHFNISAYMDERKITTTLLEGSVKINYQNKSTLIKPGEWAVNNFSTGVKVAPADQDEVMAWKNDMFVFNNENIVEIMNQISRWYDVDVVFKGNMNKINFTGNYSRTKSLKNLLKNIELMDKVHIVVVERRITIIGK